MGLRRKKSWVPALEPATFFRNVVTNCTNFLCVSAYRSSILCCHLGMKLKSLWMRYTHSPPQLLILMGLGWRKVWVPALEPGTFTSITRQEITSQTAPISYVFLHIDIHFINTSLPFGYDIKGLYAYIAKTPCSKKQTCENNVRYC